jgi:hypothetical protein
MLHQREALVDPRIELKSRSSGAHVWLEVTYAGLRPPIALFDDLAMVGWKPPAIPPPPASAIDWSRPDPATGQRFTLSDYVVEGATVEPPAGTGALGRWTPADRRAHVGVLEGILRRHGLEGSAITAPDRSRRRAASPDDATPAAPPIVAAPTPLPTGTVRLMAAIAPAAEAGTATALANVGVRGLTFTKVHRTVTYRFRGSEAEQRIVDHVRLEALVSSDDLDVARRAIADVATDLGLPTPDVVAEASGSIDRDDGEEGEADPPSGPEVLLRVSA